MENLQSLDTAVLLDLLAKHTVDYTAMFSRRRTNSTEFKECKLKIKAIQKEIEERQKAQSTSLLSDPNATLSDPNIIISQGNYP